jgi:S1-C subfamily serine protease
MSSSLMARNDSSVVQALDGQVIGITQWAGFGRAYLFPMAFIRDTIARRVIERKDNVPAGWLGATGASLGQLQDAEVASLGLDQKTGVIVREVLIDSPAAAGGINQNDVIVAIDGQKVFGISDLKAILSSYPAGQKITLKTIRERKPLTFTVVLGSRPDSDTPAGWIDQWADPVLSQKEELEKRLTELQNEYRAQLKNAHSRQRDEALKELEMELRLLMDMYRTALADAAAAGHSAQTRTPYQPVNVDRDYVQTKPATEDVTFKVGFKARELTSQLAQQLGALGGILISSVIKDSPAHRAGIRAGDVIVRSDQKRLLSIDQLQVLLSDPQRDVSLELIRAGQPTIVTLHNQ